MIQKNASNYVPTVLPVSVEEVRRVRCVCAGAALDSADLTLLLDALGIGGDWPTRWVGPIK